MLSDNDVFPRSSISDFEPAITSSGLDADGSSSSPHSELKLTLSCVRFSSIVLTQSWTRCRGVGCVAVDGLDVGIGGLDVGIGGLDVGIGGLDVGIIGASIWCSEVLKMLEMWSKESGMIA